MIFLRTFSRGALAGTGGVALTLNTVVGTRGSGEVRVHTGEIVETAASGPVAGPVDGSLSSLMYG
jgi:hypothetical protein